MILKWNVQFFDFKKLVEKNSFWKTNTIIPLVKTHKNKVSQAYTQKGSLRKFLKMHFYFEKIELWDHLMTISEAQVSRK